MQIQLEWNKNDMEVNLIVFVFLFYKVIMPPFMTDTYIKKDYSRVDNVINEVVQFVFGE